MLKLYDLLQDIEREYLLGKEDIDIDGISYDSRKVKSDYLFVCIKGFNTDGHKYIDSAIKNGAIAIVIEDEIKNLDTLLDKNITIIKVNNSRKILSKISSNLYGNSSKLLKVIGVTGTNGKTSVTHLIDTILRANKKRTAILGTINNIILDEVYKSQNTTPESLELQGLFNDMVKKNIETCTMEVSSHSLDLHRVDDINFDIGIFTNLTQDHLDYHIDMENYKKAKLKLFYKTSMANIINIDDKYGDEIYNEIKKQNIPVFSYGANRKSDFYAKDIKMHDSYSEFTLVTPSYEEKITIKIPGLFSIYNILASICACYILGLNFKEILEGLNEIKPVKGRFELVENSRSKTIIIDYAHTPDALKNVLNTIRDFTKGKIILVFGCGGDRDSKKRPIMGKIAIELADYVLLTNDNPRTEKPGKIINDILQGIEPTKDRYQVIQDRREAIREAIYKANEKDVILIAGKGHENYQIIGDKVFDFDDREVAKEILEEENI